MPRPSRPWFRFYVEAVHDRKLRREKPEHRWLFVACLAAARQSAEPGRLLVGADRMTLDDLADFAGMPCRQVQVGLDRLVASGVVAEDDRGWFVPSWDQRQFESDDVTERTRRHRSKERSNVVAGNAPETEAETDTEPCTSSAAATTSLDRRRLLEAAAATIGARAAQRPGTRDPAATAKAVARAVITDRHEDAYRAIAARPTITAEELAQQLEPVEPERRLVLPPAHVDEAIADLAPPPAQRIPDEARNAGLAAVRELAASRRTPEDAA